MTCRHCQKTEPTPIDWSKPIETMDGGTARVICSDLSDPAYKWAVAFFNLASECEEVRTYRDNGMTSSTEHPYDIINVI